MASIETAASTAGGVGAGVGTTLLVRQQFDQTGETTVLRPSVLWGIGTGAASLGAAAFLDMNGMVGEFLEDYGEVAIAAGAFSAFNPKGGDVQLPTI